MDYGTASKARLVASIINKRERLSKSAFAVYRGGIYTVVLSVMPPSDIV